MGTDGKVGEEESEGILHPEGMRAVRDLSEGIAHEVNNVLGVIIGNAHLSQKELADDHVAQKFLGEIRSASEAGRTLMKDLGMLTGQRAFRPHVISVNDLLERATGEITASTELDLDQRDPKVLVDLWFTQEAIGSVLAFMAACPAVSVLRATTTSDGSILRLILEDNGPTPSDAELRRLFVPLANISGRPKPLFSLTKLADLAARFEGAVVGVGTEKGGLRIELSLPLASD